MIQTDSLLMRRKLSTLNTAALMQNGIQQQSFFIKLMLKCRKRDHISLNQSPINSSYPDNINTSPPLSAKLSLLKSRSVQNKPQGTTPMKKIHGPPIYQIPPFDCTNGRYSLFNEIHGRKNLSQNITTFNLSFTGLLIIYSLLELPAVMRAVHNSP